MDGGECRGVIEVLDVGHSEDPASLSELMVLHHLLVERQVVGEGSTGHNLGIEVSKGAIRKLARHRGSKRSLVAFTQFLATRFSDARLTVERDRSWIDPKAPREVLHATGPELACVESPQLGTVVITRHALDRYVERFGVRDRSRGWQKLGQRLSRSPLCKVPIPDRARIRKYIRYGQNAEIWRQKNTPVNFVLTSTRHGNRVLLTVFIGE